MADSELGCQSYDDCTASGIIVAIYENMEKKTYMDKERFTKAAYEAANISFVSEFGSLISY